MILIQAILQTLTDLLLSQLPGKSSGCVQNLSLHELLGSKSSMHMPVE